MGKHAKEEDADEVCQRHESAGKLKRKICRRGRRSRESDSKVKKVNEEKEKVKKNDVKKNERRATHT